MNTNKKNKKTMEKFNELLKKLQALNITQTKGDWAENLPEDIWEDYFKASFKEVKSGLNVNTERWYETSTSVIEVCGGLLGITFITNMFSESQDYEDCCVTIEFNQMKEEKTISYKCL